MAAGCAGVGDKEEEVVMSEPDYTLHIGAPYNVPPQKKCGTHGTHGDWVGIFFNTGVERWSQRGVPYYCMRCLLEFLDKQSIGKVYEGEGT